MESLTGWAASAAEKMAHEIKDVTENKARVMAPAVMEALKAFCRQSNEFAEAVATGDSFHACMKAVEKGVGNSISDMEAYKKAVAFYMPGAEIEMTMRIHTKQEETKTTGTIEFDLTRFLKL